MPGYRMEDTAFFTDQLIAEAKATGVKAIGGYLFDPFLGAQWPVAGWTTANIQKIINAGLYFIPIFTQDANTGQVCDAATAALAISRNPSNTKLVALDVESGSDMGRAWNQAWFNGLRNAGYNTIEYGSASTLARDAGIAEYRWVADYVRSGFDDSLNPAPGADAWQYAGSVQIDGVDVDISNSLIPLGSAPQPPQPPPISHVVGGDDLIGFTFRPSNWGTGAFDYVYVASDNTVTHVWGSTASSVVNQESLGGWADPRFGASCGWSADGAVFYVSCVGSDGHIYTIGWDEKWGYWVAFTVGAAPSGKPMIPLAPQESGPGPEGPAGPQGPAGPGLTPAVEADLAQLAKDA